MDVVLGCSDSTHTVHKAWAVFTSSVLSNTTALVGLAERCHEAAPAGAPYYEAIIKAYSFCAARVIASFLSPIV